MKAKITSEFFCSYFYNSAIANLKMMLQQKSAPDTQYFGLAVVILFHCTLESYINFMIYNNSLESLKIKLNGNTKKLIELSIKRKWLELPKNITNKTYKENELPFSDFIQFVDLRNKLVHFKTEKRNITIQLPNEKMTAGDLYTFLNQPNAIKDHILMDIVPFAKAGRDITNSMIKSLHDMLDTKAPNFLTGSEEIISLKIIRD